MSQSNVTPIQPQPAKPAEHMAEQLEAKPQARRRIWTATAKLKVLKEIEELKGHQADIGAYLRRQGLFSNSFLVSFQQLDFLLKFVLNFEVTEKRIEVL